MEEKENGDLEELFGNEVQKDEFECRKGRI